MSAQDEDPPGARRAPGDPAEPTRLVDDPAVRADVSAAWALSLLRGAEPYRAPAGRKQRVQLRLGHTPRRHAPLVLRLAVIALVLCGGAAVVSAALGHWPGWMARAYERVVGEPPAGHAPTRARAPRHGAAAREAASREATAIEAPSGEAPFGDRPPSEMAPPAAESEIRTPAPAAPVARAPEAHPQRDAVAPRPRRAVVSAAPVGEDASAVSAAMRALRVERNPVRARGLLARYLSEHPNGNLAEEALAMSIEAAIAHHDADVADLAHRYLRIYPQGSFQALARQALAAPIP